MQRGVGGRLRLRLLLVAVVGVVCGLSALPAFVVGSEPVHYAEVEVTARGDAVGDLVLGTAGHSTSHLTAPKDGPDAEKTGQQDAIPIGSVGELSVVSPHDTRRDPSGRPMQSLTKAALAKELEAIELMVKLQQKKLELLEKIRLEALREESIIAEPETRKLHSKDYSDLIERKIEAMTAAAVHEMLASSSQQNFNALFVEKAAVATPSPVVDMKMMKLRATGIQDLLVVALEDGTIEFYIAPAQLLLRFQVDVGRTVRSIDVELHGERPTLAIIYNEPLVTLYALELTQNGRHLIGNQAENATSLSDDSVRFASSPGLPYSLKVAPVAGIRFSAAPTAITMTRTSKRSVVSVGTDDGGIAFFSLNGSELHKMETRSMIRAMASHRHLLAFTNGSNTVLVPLSRGQDPPLITCPGSTGEVTSIAFDPVHGDLVYAGTSIGEVLVYSFRDSTPSMLENGEREACTLVARALTKKPSFSSRVAPLKLYALKGYVITSGAAELVVFNVSRGLNGGVQIESTCSLQSAGSATISPSSNDRFLPLAVSEGSSVINVAYAAVMTPTTGESAITVFQSLLPSKSSERTDGSWISFLYIGTVVVVVLMCQFCVRRPSQSQSVPSNPWEVLKSRKHDASFGHSGASDNSGSSADLSGYDFDGLGRNSKLNSARDPGNGGSRGRHDRGSRVGDVDGNSNLGSDRNFFNSPYDSLSDDLKRKIFDTRKETLECSFDGQKF